MEKATEKSSGFQQHERSNFQEEALCSWIEYKKHISDNQPCLLCRYRLALTGHSESASCSNKGNFLEIRYLFSEQDEIISTRLKRSKAKYASAQIQNEIIYLLYARFIYDLSEEIAESTQFSRSMDESKDTSRKEQLSIVVRYVYTNSIYKFMAFVQLNK